MRFSFGGVSLTCVGKAAPPRPTTPASRMRARRSSTDRADQSDAAGQEPPSGDSPSGVSMTTVGTSVGMAGCRCGRTAVTFPEIGACTAAETKPPGSPIGWPARTRSPSFTRGFAGAPVCMCSGTMTRLGSGMSSMDFRSVQCLFPGGCTPPLKVRALMVVPAVFYSPAPERQHSGGMPPARENTNCVYLSEVEVAPDG